MKECQHWVDSPEFSEWMAFYAIEREANGDEEQRPPTTSELGDKIRGWAEAQNARQ